MSSEPVRPERMPTSTRLLAQPKARLLERRRGERVVASGGEMPERIPRVPHQLGVGEREGRAHGEEAAPLSVEGPAQNTFRRGERLI
jgi:hypothetical protein